MIFLENTIKNLITNSILFKVLIDSQSHNIFNWIIQSEIFKIKLKNEISFNISKKSNEIIYLLLENITPQSFEQFSKYGGKFWLIEILINRKETSLLETICEQTNDDYFSTKDYLKAGNNPLLMLIFEYKYIQTSLFTNQDNLNKIEQMIEIIYNKDSNLYHLYLQEDSKLTIEIFLDVLDKSLNNKIKKLFEIAKIKKNRKILNSLLSQKENNTKKIFSI